MWSRRPLGNNIGWKALVMKLCRLLSLIFVFPASADLLRNFLTLIEFLCCDLWFATAAGGGKIIYF